MLFSVVENFHNKEKKLVLLQNSDDHFGMVLRNTISLVVFHFVSSLSVLVFSIFTIYFVF